MPICRLCRQERSLCESHILPEFMYQPVYEEQAHKYFELSTAVDSHPKRRPKGLYERLLCKSCEDRIGTTEAYARAVLYGGTEIVVSNHDWGLRIEGLDYAKLKLFQLGVLWRAGVSSLVEFDAVCLGPKEEELRSMLMAGQPGQPGEYPCFMFFSPTLHRDLGDRLILLPDRLRVGGAIAYRIFMGGLFWVFFPSARPRILPPPGFLLSADGVLVVLRSDPIADRFVQAVATAFKRAGGIDRALGRSC